MRKPEDLKTKLEKLDVKSGTFDILELDLTSLDSVKKFGNEILAKNVPIHVLLNNAGVMFGPRRETKDGIELQIGKFTSGFDW